MHRKKKIEYHKSYFYLLKIKYSKKNDKLDNLLGGSSNYSLKKKIRLGLIIGIPLFIIIIIIIAVAAFFSSSGD